MKKRKQGGSRSSGRDVLTVFNKKRYGKGRREDPEPRRDFRILLLLLLLLLLSAFKEKRKEGGSRAPGRDFLLVFNKEQ